MRTNKNNSGLTLIELIIVLAILVVISAILIPNFMGTTDRAKLRADAQSANVLNNAILLHNMEQPNRIAPNATVDGAGGVLEVLDNLGYIDKNRARTQTEGAVFIVNAQGLARLDINGSPSHIRNEVYKQLSDLEKEFIEGGQP